MDDGFDALFGNHVHTVAEWEEGIGCGTRAVEVETGILRFAGGDAGAVHAAHLACANAVGLTAFAEDDGVGFDVFCDVPDKQQIVPLLLGRLAFGDDFQIGAADAVDVGGLYQQSAADAFEFEAVRACFERYFQYAHVFLGGGDFEGFGGKLRRHQNFHKLVVGNLFHGFAVDFAIESDDAAECAGGVGDVGEFVGGQCIGCNGDAARIGVFHNHTGWCVKGFDGFPCGIGIGDVVVRQFFALQLFVGGKAACGGVNIAVERGALVRVFAVAHVLHFDPALVELAWEFADLGLAAQNVV
ncbi:Uncharacterised protein [Neisseria meningitidis]|nr:Uncharacterised protein [Neisseria meningitidis]CWT75059.1 Uncharacterised protein [Neisseria meningitidis]